MRQASWLIFTPPGATDEASLEKLRLVRDGFSIWPLIFGPFWFLAKRLWLGALVSAILVGAAFAARIMLNIADPWGTLITFLPSLLMALEAPTFERRKLLRLGWGEAGVLRAANAAEAEAKSIARLSADADETPRRLSPPPAPQQTTSGFAANGPVLGLFPEAAGQR